MECCKLSKNLEKKILSKTNQYKPRKNAKWVNKNWTSTISFVGVISAYCDLYLNNIESLGCCQDQENTTICIIQGSAVITPIKLDSKVE